MFSLNRVQLIGYLTQPVEVRQTPSNQSVTELNIATPYTFQAENGQTLSGTGFHTVTAWGGMADVAAQYLKPGSQVFLSGRLQTDTWEDEKSGEKRSKTRMVAMDLIMLDPRDGQIEAPASASAVTSCLNRADVIGHLTRDPEMRTTTNGQNVLTVGVATNERWKDKASGEMKERTEFHNVVIWGELAEACSKNLKKGMRVHAAGRVQSRSWETKTGSKRVTTEIVADSLSMLGVKNTEISYTDKTLSERFGAKGSAEAPKAEAPAAAATKVPEVNYEQSVKAEDLPF